VKRNWIKVRSGLLDKKHIAALGMSPWPLYLYILDHVDWDTGKISYWKDEEVAIDLGVQTWKVRECRKVLENIKFISCAKLQRCQELKVEKWMSPYDRLGTENHAPKSLGIENPVPKKGLDTPQSTPQTFKTPIGTCAPSYSKTTRQQDIKNKSGAKNAPASNLFQTEVIVAEPKKIGEVIGKLDWVDAQIKYAKQPDPIMEYPEDCQAVLREFCRLWQMTPPSRGHSGYAKWIQDARELRVTINDGGLPLLVFVYREWKNSPRPFSVVSPGSIVNTVRAMAGRFVQERKVDKPCVECLGKGYVMVKATTPNEQGRYIWDKVPCPRCGKESK